MICKFLGLMEKKIKYSFNENYVKINPKEHNTLTIEYIENDNWLDQEYKFKSLNILEEKPIQIETIKKLPCTWRDVYHVKLSECIDYEPGDAVGLIVPNSDLLVEKLMSICEFCDKLCRITRNGRESFVFTGYLKDFFKHRMDLKSLPRKLQLFNLAKNASKRKELEYMISMEGRSDYMKLGINWNNIIEIIEEFGCKPTVEDLLRNCELIKPRYFSLLNKRGTKSEILVGIINKIIAQEGPFSNNKINNQNQKLGHFSEFIDITYKNGGKIPPITYVFRKNKLTEKLKSTNVLCYCTGTGIAPFISLYRNIKSNDKLRLIYGYRNDEDDLADIFGVKCNITKCKSAENSYITDYYFLADGKSDIFICGNPNMQKSLFFKLKEHNIKLVEDQKIFFDNWQ